MEKRNVIVRERFKGSNNWYIFFRYHDKQKARRIGQYRVAKIIAKKLEDQLKKGNSDLSAFDQDLKRSISKYEIFLSFGSLNRKIKQLKSWYEPVYLEVLIKKNNFESGLNGYGMPYGDPGRLFAMEDWIKIERLANLAFGLVCECGSVFIKIKKACADALDIENYMKSQQKKYENHNLVTMEEIEETRREWRSWPPVIPRLMADREFLLDENVKLRKKLNERRA